jgi:hypothetical protein
MSEALPGLAMPRHPGRPNRHALELAYDGAIPLEAQIGADIADGRLHDEWVKRSRRVLVLYALRQAHDALKDSSDGAYIRRAAAAGVVSAVLSQPEMQEA